MNNFIEIYKNVFDDNFCKTMIEQYENGIEQGFGLTRQEHDKVSKTQKEDTSFFYNSNYYLPVKIVKQDLVNNFNSIFWETCYKHYADKYAILQTAAHHNSYEVKIQKTRPGQGYHDWHFESMGRDTANRLLTWTVYLNDEFEAGETEFLYQHYRYKPQKGDCIIFPAAYTHTHRGNPPIGGDKYIITGWVEF